MADALLAAAIVFGTALAMQPHVAGGVPAGLATGAPDPASPATAPVAPSVPLRELLGSPLEAVPGAAGLQAPPGAVAAPAPAGASFPLLVTLGFRNGSRLGEFLTALNDPASSEYHQYLSADAFTAQFSPNASSYATVLEYLNSFGVSSLTAYPDRLAVSFTATSAEAGALLHAPVERFSEGASTYWAAVAAPSLPAPVAAQMVAVNGLGESALAAATPAASVGPERTVAQPGAGARSIGSRPATVDSLAPVKVGTAQYLYPADLQTGYDEESLLTEYGYPVNARIAALVWPGIYEGSSPVVTACGTLTPGEEVGPYDPADFSNFFATTLPSGEPVPTVVNVSVEGSPSPSCSASYDTTGIVAATTAEIEATGAMAPGATIYAVSAPGPSITELETSLETVLSPPLTLPASVRGGLLNVSVVEIGWGTKNATNLAWLEDLQQVEARGITVVAASGNSGDDEHSTAWVGTDAEFPASAANDTVGALAVGGTTTVLNPTTDHLASEVVWNVSAADVSDGGPAGSAGGVSMAYPEPAFQENTSANAVLQDEGRGVPDVAAVANNSLVTLTVNGTQYTATNATYGDPNLTADGTGVAAGYVAGMLAVVDHVLQTSNASWLGYVDPVLYSVANEAYSPAPSGAPITSTETGSYDSALPTAPFYDVTSGANDQYRARVGYDLVTGWGSLDAANYTMYVLHVPETGVYGALDGVRDRVHLSGLNVTSRFATGLVDESYNASVQQTFFLANSLGAPVYWAQSVVYLRESSGSWAMNFTAWVSYPFWGLYPQLEVHEAWFPVSGQRGGFPQTMTLTTSLAPASGSTPPELVFTFGEPETPTLTLHVPGAAFIIGRTGYSYLWQGVTYTDGPKDGKSSPGFLAPQLIVVGAPPNATGYFRSGTSGNVTASVEAAGTTVYSPAKTGLLNASNEQSSASSANVSYTQDAANGFNFSYHAGVATPGIYQVELPYFPVTFTESGVPDGATWYVNLSNAIDLTGTASTHSVSTGLENGTYGWTATVDLRNWSSVPGSGSITVNGMAVTVPLAFGPSNGEVAFTAKGPETSGRLDFDWFVNISGQPVHAVGNATNYSEALSFGTYSYKIGCSDPGYAATKPSGSFTIGAAEVKIAVTFAVKTYTITFLFHLPSPPPKMTISLGGISQSGSFATWGVDEPNGTYGWSITGLPFGYTATPSSGSVVVHGPVSVIVVTIRDTGWGPFGLGWIGYGIVVGAGVAAVWVAAFYVRRSRRRRRSPQPVAPAAEPEAAEPARGRRPPRRRRGIGADEL